MTMTVPSHLRRCFLIALCLSSLQCMAPSRPEPPQRSPQSPPASRIQVAPGDAQRIGQKIWQNEAGGKISGLTSWNKGEQFASLGIGHFIWYPAGIRHTYQESFPPLLRYLQSRGVQLPPGISPSAPCPWPDRAAFNRATQSQTMRDLRQMLSRTVGLQTEFIIQRMQTALPKILQTAQPSERQQISNRFHAVAGTPNGVYALIDYVNFKGEGVNPKERYQGRGWGLLQVLQGMRGRPTGQAAAREFAASAKRTLDRRIALAPKDETRWRTGWFRRCDTYAQPW